LTPMGWVSAGNYIYNIDSIRVKDLVSNFNEVMIQNHLFWQWIPNILAIRCAENILAGMTSMDIDIVGVGINILCRNSVYE